MDFFWRNNDILTNFDIVAKSLERESSGKSSDDLLRKIIDKFWKWILMRKNYTVWYKYGQLDTIKNHLEKHKS